MFRRSCVRRIYQMSVLLTAYPRCSGLTIAQKAMEPASPPFPTARSFVCHSTGIQSSNRTSGVTTARSASRKPEAPEVRRLVTH